MDRILWGCLSVCLFLIGLGYFLNLLGHHLSRKIANSTDSIIWVAALWSKMCEDWMCVYLPIFQLIFFALVGINFRKNEFVMSRKSEFTNISVGICLCMIAMWGLSLWDMHVLGSMDGELVVDGSLSDINKRKLSSAWIVYLCFGMMGWIMTCAGILRLVRQTGPRIVLLFGATSALGHFGFAVTLKSLPVGMGLLAGGSVVIAAGVGWQIYTTTEEPGSHEEIQSLVNTRPQVQAEMK